MKKKEVTPPYTIRLDNTKYVYTLTKEKRRQHLKVSKHTVHGISNKWRIISDRKHFF